MHLSALKALDVNAWPKPKLSLNMTWLTALLSGSIREQVSAFWLPNPLTEQH